MATRRTQEEIKSLLDGYRRRTVTRTEYCREQDITPSALDYYRRRYDSKPTRFARVKMTAHASESGGAFALVLRNGRRIESTWNFRDADLTRLIRAAEVD